MSVGPTGACLRTNAPMKTNPRPVIRFRFWFRLLPSRRRRRRRRRRLSFSSWSLSIAASGFASSCCCCLLLLLHLVAIILLLQLRRALPPPFVDGAARRIIGNCVLASAPCLARWPGPRTAAHRARPQPQPTFGTILPSGALLARATRSSHAFPSPDPTPRTRLDAHGAVQHVSMRGGCPPGTVESWELGGQARKRPLREGGQDSVIRPSTTHSRRISLD